MKPVMEVNNSETSPVYIEKYKESGSGFRFLGKRWLSFAFKEKRYLPLLKGKAEVTATSIRASSETRENPVAPTSCPWVSKDEKELKNLQLVLPSVAPKITRNKIRN